eukprot:TRINITY_DN9444_c0_g1_i1.p2 TRINITY_DN9444_c0_g1~~TRINITY_DN9444_c0_g1_i1.p2  ORF type:complete len:184 (+),score=95.06 TRINITY_DN9444_c0_g1_i1:2-553(+)
MNFSGQLESQNSFFLTPGSAISNKTSTSSDKLAQLEKSHHQATIVKSTKIVKPSPDTLGRKWFGMVAPKVTKELTRDLQILRLRSMIHQDKHFKKEKASKNKYFEIGEVIESSADFYSSRLTKKNRPKSFVDELLRDDSFRKTTKAKYNKINKDRATVFKKPVVHINAKIKKKLLGSKRAKNY